MMKKLDLYILRKFMGTFVYAISLILVIVIVFDISEKIDDFIQKEAPLKAIVVDYYFNFLPYFANLFSPLFTFISVIFFTSQMASRTEIVAILSSGVSFRRMLLPYMIGASIIAVASMYLSNFLIPNANQRRIDFEEVYIKNKFRNQDQHIHRQIAPGSFIYMEKYTNETNTGIKFSLEQIGGGKLHYKLMAELIRWDSTRSKWKIMNYTVRYINKMEEVMVNGAEMDTTLNFHPRDFGRKLNNIETMDYFTLGRYIHDEKMKGADNLQYYEIEKYKRFAFPCATLILTLIGVSLASRKVRGGIGIHLAIGLLIAFSFILFMQVSTTFAASGLVSPFVSVWIPNLLYGALAFFLLKKAPK